MYINIQVHPSRCTCIKLLDFLQVQNKNKIFKKNEKILEDRLGRCAFLVLQVLDERKDAQGWTYGVLHVLSDALERRGVFYCTKSIHRALTLLRSMGLIDAKKRHKEVLAYDYVQKHYKWHGLSYRIHYEAVDNLVCSNVQKKEVLSNIVIYEKNEISLLEMVVMIKDQLGIQYKLTKRSAHALWVLFLKKFKGCFDLFKSFLGKIRGCSWLTKKSWWWLTRFDVVDRIMDIEISSEKPLNASCSPLRWGYEHFKKYITWGAKTSFVPTETLKNTVFRKDFDTMNKIEDPLGREVFKAFGDKTYQGWFKQRAVVNGRYVIHNKFEEDYFSWNFNKKLEIIYRRFACHPVV